MEIEFQIRKDKSEVAMVHIGNQIFVMSVDEWQEAAQDILNQIVKHKGIKNPAAVAMGNITSDKKATASRKNGKLGGRHKKNHEDEHLYFRCDGKVRKPIDGV